MNILKRAHRQTVRQPFLRRNELVKPAAAMFSISARHAGGDPEVVESREHVWGILEYYFCRKDISDQRLMPAFEQNQAGKHDAVNHTAALTRPGIDVVCAGLPDN